MVSLQRGWVSWDSVIVGFFSGKNTRHICWVFCPYVLLLLCPLMHVFTVGMVA